MKHPILNLNLFQKPAKIEKCPPKFFLLVVWTKTNWSYTFSKWISWQISSNWLFQRNVDSDLEKAQTSEPWFTIKMASGENYLQFSKHWPPGPMLSISRNVRLSVCPSVGSLLRYCLNVFLPPLPKVGCPIFLEIQNPWGKVMERRVFRFEHFCLNVV